jgi:uncharacterized membrane protein
MSQIVFFSFFNKLSDYKSMEKLQTFVCKAGLLISMSKWTRTSSLSIKIAFSHASPSFLSSLHLLKGVFSLWRAGVDYKFPVK